MKKEKKATDWNAVIEFVRTSIEEEDDRAKREHDTLSDYFIREDNEVTLGGNGHYVGRVEAFLRDAAKGYEEHLKAERRETAKFLKEAVVRDHHLTPAQAKRIKVIDNIVHVHVNRPAGKRWVAAIGCTTSYGGGLLTNLLKLPG